MKEKVVIAIGGNSIIKPGEEGTITQQWNTTLLSCRRIARIAKMGYQVIITHGNGPQVGNILLRSELSKNELPTLPLDVCVADSQGGMGYMIQQLLDSELKRLGISRPVITLLTQVVVDRDDPAFENPSKPIGPFYTAVEADEHRIRDHWEIKEDSGRGFRRVVASPKPRQIVELKAIEKLIESGYMIVTLGGGGIPVIELANGAYQGAAAVIDKDMSSALLAAQIKADILIITTGVDFVYINFGKENQQKIETMTVSTAKRYIEEGQFAAGSMLPKIQAAIYYLENGGDRALITSPENLENRQGTLIVNDEK